MAPCATCGFEKALCVCEYAGGVSPARRIWEKLGEEGRALLTREALLPFWLPLHRRSSSTLVISDGHDNCAVHPLERIAKEWNCACSCCAGSVWGRATSHEVLAEPLHATALVRAFLCSPDLAFPPDIPAYAKKCLEYLRQKEGVIAQRMKQEQKRKEAQEAFRLAHGKASS